MSDSKFEILAPAGNLATLKSAINNGADAVYIGGKAFSARKNAVNFTNEEIIEAINYSHIYGAKVYITLNTLVSDEEITSVYDFVKFLYEAGADALIIQDLGILKMVKECFPDFEVHASTQMTIHNKDGAKVSKKLGFSRVVLSRELSFDEIKHISESTDIELEVFVHGALCMSYSGQCLMSSFLGARSGNRGLCAQPCRLPYTLLSKDKKPISPKEKYLLSLKDLCLVDELDALKDCKVKSLKIEGRMKSAEYVSLVTSIYDKYRNGTKVSKEDYKALESIFSRSGFTKGYLSCDTGRNMLNFDKNNDDVYHDISPEVLKRATELKDRKPSKIPFDASVTISMGQPMSLCVSAKNVSVSVEGNIPSQTALNVSLDLDRIKAQISKTGDTPFELRGFEAHIDENISLPIKEINEIRRKALAELSLKLSKLPREIKPFVFDFKPNKTENTSKKLYVAEVKTLPQAKAALDLGFDKIIVPLSLYREIEDKKQFGKKLSVILPPVMRDNRKLLADDIPNEVYATNLSHFSTFSDKEVIADFRLNTFNSASAQKLSEMGAKSVCLSPELNVRQIAKLSASVPLEVIAYGRIPVMTVQNCVVKSSLNKCGCTLDVYWLRDRKGMDFPLFADKDSCTNIIYNAVPVYMADRLDEIGENISSLRFIFTTESPDEIGDIFTRYKNKKAPSGDITRGHFFRGV